MYINKSKNKKKISSHKIYNEAGESPIILGGLTFNEQFIFKFQDSDIDEKKSMTKIEYLDNLKYSFELVLKFKSYEDYFSKIRYFESEKDFKIFVQYCRDNMIPVVSSQCSNIRGIGIQGIVYNLEHIKEECNKANKIFQDKTVSKPNLQHQQSEVKISTVEELKLLEAILIDIEQTYFEDSKRNYIDITTLSKRKLNEAHINMNMFFNEEIRMHLFEHNLENKGVAFYNEEQSWSIAFPNEIHLQFKENFLTIAKEFIKKNKSDWGRLSLNLINIIKYK